MRELDDDAAYMALVTSNSQGELSPLERGIHFNLAGKGTRDYARVTGRSPAGITFESQAGKVFTYVNSTEKLNADSLSEKSRHLSEIHSLPPECWPSAVQIMLDKGWSAKETGEQVKAANVGYSAKATTALLAGKTSIREIQRITEIRDRVNAALAYDDLKEEWETWFNAADTIRMISRGLALFCR